jgi:hypothetical protein
MHILLFKTNINTDHDLHRASILLDASHSILQWNIDREDVDNVLRIESSLDNKTDIMEAMIEAGFSCEELID